MNAATEPTNAPVSNWQPRWKVTDSRGDDVGITVDDHCFVVLVQNEGRWKPSAWIPAGAAKLIGILSNAEIL